jgi:hypothetical protein
MDASNRYRTGTSRPNANCSRALTRMAISESPPRAKKSSSSPTRSTPNTSANTSATIFSVWVAGARNAVAANTGAGSALRSILPEEVNGNSSSTTIWAGTM